MSDPVLASDAIKYVYATLSALIIGGATILIKKKKSKSQRINDEIENVGKALEIWRKTSEQLVEDIKELNKKIVALESENRTLKFDMETVIKENKELNSRKG